MRKLNLQAAVTTALAIALLAACSTTPPPLPEPLFDAPAAVRAIRAAGGAASSELDVQPLRDPQVEDLRKEAERLEKTGQYPQAAASLDQALQLNPGDPALLQERAESALLNQQLDEAERFARQGLDGGSRVGPLCRRHWETIAQVRDAKARALPVEVPGAASASDARRERDACTISAPPRY